MKKRFYSTSEVARICSVHRNTIITAIRKNRLKAYRTPGGHSRVARDDLLAYCRERGLPVEEAEGHNDRLLVLSGTPNDAEATFNSMKGRGYRVTVVGDAFAAGYHIATGEPDIVVLDVDDPVGDMKSLSSLLRAVKSSRQTRAIALAPRGDMEVADALFRAGADDVLPRPIELDELVARVVDLIGPIQPEDGRPGDTRDLPSGTGIVEPVSPGLGTHDDDKGRAIA